MIVSIVGVGLIGGSLGRALVRGKKGRVVGVGRRPARLRKALSLRCAHKTTTDLAAGVSGADIVVLAVPVSEIIPLAHKIRPFLKEGCLVMDVGSVKAPVVQGAEDVFKGRGVSFVGAHPMAGSEKSGVEFSSADLFKGAVCVLTPTRATPRAALKKAVAFWRGVGARVTVLSPHEHDRRVALVSHLPHLIADALVLSAAKRCGVGETKLLAAGSFRDATRVAASDPALWSAIFNMNASCLKEAVSEFQSVLGDLLMRRWPLRELLHARTLHEKMAPRAGRGGGASS